jgi:hypothetical protein
MIQRCFIYLVPDYAGAAKERYPSLKKTAPTAKEEDGRG